MLLKFTKYQALGNDFIILDERKSTQDGFVPSITPEQCQKLCNRHFGIGADGILSIFATKNEEEQIYMHVFNADGSVAKMCGNGARCVIDWLKKEQGLKSLSGKLKTDSGLKKFEHDGQNISVNMGIARLGEAKNFSFEKSSVDGFLVNLGNEHLIITESFDRKTSERLAKQIAQSYEGANHPNISFVSVTGPAELMLLVYENGVGFTMACGSGACAAAAFCYAQGLIASTNIDVHQPGGSVNVELVGDKNRLEVLMKGRASEVFSGAIEI